MAETLTKLDIVRELSERNRRYGITVAATRRIVDGVFETMARRLLKGHRIEIRNFGVFKVVDRAPRVARNPRTRKRLEVPASKAVRFITGKELHRKLQRLMDSQPAPPEK